MPRFSICIPAYNRARFLPALLESIRQQSFRDYEVVIAEDKSPERESIRSIVRDFYDGGFKQLRYHENSTNLGYDANIRNLVDLAKGEYLFFMGNDDIVAPEALATVDASLNRHPGAGVVLRAYGWFQNTPESLDQVVRYFTQERVFPASPETAALFFRRVGVISGFIIHRASASRYHTSEFDGSLFYQMYLAGNVCLDVPGVSVPDVLIYCRDNIPPEFGASLAEREHYTPGSYTRAARVKMLTGMLDIAKHIDRTRSVDVANAVQLDIEAYFYPYIRDIRRQGLREFFQLFRDLREVGFGRSYYFYLHFLLTAVLGRAGYDATQKFIRSALGRSPHLGAVTKRQ